MSTAGRTYDPEGTRDAILSAARRLFGEIGYDPTSVRELARAAGVTKGAFYHHFATKGAVLSELHGAFLDDLEAAVADILGDGAAHPDERLRSLIGALMQRVELYRDIVLVFLHHSRQLGDDASRQLARRQSAIDRDVLTVVRDAMGSGAFRGDLDAHAVTYGIFGMCTWAYRWWRPGGGLTPEEAADQFATLVLEGLTPARRTPGAGRGTAQGR